MREATLRELAPTDDDERVLLHAWPFWARPQQLAPPGDWRVWLVLAGRGFGKTRNGAEWVITRARPGARIALVAPTAPDARDVMVEGESGIMAVSPPWNRPVYEPSKRRLTWPNGAIATTFTAEEPERLRGPQYTDAWCDEIAAWKYPETWDQLQFGLRLGSDPRVVATTTPRPIPLIRELLKDPSTHVTRGRTYDNAANLAAPFLQAIRKKYEGTRLGRQELEAELLDDTPGALWTYALIDAARVRTAPGMRRIVIAIDPSVSTGEGSDETGMVAAGLGDDGDGYVMRDLSGKFSPADWGRRAVLAYEELQADRIVAEVNNGGDMVEATIRTAEEKIRRERDGNFPRVAFRAVHASRGKRTRAEPVSALYEQGRVHHVGSMPVLEDQQCTWDASSGAKSPDRLDAAVWGLTDLMLASRAAGFDPAVLDGIPNRRI